MQNVKATLDQLKQQGIAPKVIINLPTENPDIPKARALQAELQKASIVAEFHINLDLGTGAGETPDETGTTAGSFEVMVTQPHLNCWKIKTTNAAGRPLMDFSKPRIQLNEGTRFRVSATAKVGPKDVGDGLIIADGGVIFYQVTECQTNPNVVGMYVRQVDVKRL